MPLETKISSRLVKSEDLNHHQTLFAGRCAEWFVEASFITVASKLKVDSVVCLKIHGLEFLHPVHAGDILNFESKIISGGKSTLTTYTRVYRNETPDITFCDGFVTFVHVDENTRPQPHGLIIVPETEQEIEMNAKAKQLILLSKSLAKN
jgi:acyl-CoA hydrolase